MLIATSRFEFGDSRLAAATILDERFRAQLVWRHHLLFDSRFLVPNPHVRGHSTLYFMHAGEAATGSTTHSAPFAVAAAPGEYECYAEGQSFLRTWGDPCVTLDVQLLDEDVLVPIGLSRGALSISEPTWDAISALAEALAVGDPLEPPMQAVVARLSADGLVSPRFGAPRDPEPAALRRLWDALVPFHARWDTSLEMVDLAEQAAMSSRQLSRDAKALIERLGFGDARFRDVIRVVRLRLATLLLSAVGMTIEEVATHVGYGSVDALGRAFRDAGLLPPTMVRDAVRSPT
jgi:AraC-like DNA-binding protein